MEKQLKMNLSNKKVLITGAAGLLGTEFANFLIKFNAQCICIDKDLNLLKKNLVKLKIKIFYILNVILQNQKN